MHFNQQLTIQPLYLFIQENYGMLFFEANPEVHTIIQLNMIALTIKSL